MGSGYVPVHREEELLDGSCSGYVHECSFLHLFHPRAGVLGSLLNSKTADGTVIYNTAVAYPIGIVFAALLLALFIRATKKRSAKKSA